MIRRTRGKTAAQPRKRSIPPLPHPSWTFGDYPRQSAAALEPDDFWRRLGI